MLLFFLLNRSGARWFFGVGNLLIVFLVMFLNSGEGIEHFLLNSFLSIPLLVIPFFLICHPLFLWYYVLKDEHDKKLSFKIRFLDSYILTTFAFFLIVRIVFFSAVVSMGGVIPFAVPLVIEILVGKLMLHMAKVKFVSENVGRIQFTNFKKFSDLAPYLEEIRVLIADIADEKDDLPLGGKILVSILMVLLGIGLLNSRREISHKQEQLVVKEKEVKEKIAKVEKDITKEVGYLYSMYIEQIRWIELTKSSEKWEKIPDEKSIWDTRPDVRDKFEKFVQHSRFTDVHTLKVLKEHSLESPLYFAAAIEATYVETTEDFWDQVEGKEPSNGKREVKFENGFPDSFWNKFSEIFPQYSEEVLQQLKEDIKELKVESRSLKEDWGKRNAIINGIKNKMLEQSNPELSAKIVEDSTNPFEGSFEKRKQILKNKFEERKRTHNQKFLKKLSRFWGLSS